MVSISTKVFVFVNTAVPAVDGTNKKNRAPSSQVAQKQNPFNKKKQEEEEESHFQGNSWQTPLEENSQTNGADSSAWECATHSASGTIFKQNSVGATILLANRVQGQIETTTISSKIHSVINHASTVISSSDMSIWRNAWTSCTSNTSTWLLRKLNWKKLCF